MPAESPTLTFLLSVRHPVNSTDYTRVEALLVRTLRSLDAQTDRRCAAVVVANREVDLPGDLSLPVKVVVVDFPPPSSHRGPSTGREAVLLDKGTKLAAALAASSSSEEVGYVMFVDADDFVSRHLTAFVADHWGARGWYVDEGLMVDERGGSGRPVSHFNEVCGTSLIVRRDLLPRVELTTGAGQEEVLARYGADTVRELFGSHRYLAERYALAPLPFVGAAYAVSTGENHSGKHMTQLGTYLDATTRAEFGMPSPRARLPRARYVLHGGTAVVRRSVREVGRAVLKAVRR